MKKYNYPGCLIKVISKRIRTLTGKPLLKLQTLVLRRDSTIDEFRHINGKRRKRPRVSCSREDVLSQWVHRGFRKGYQRQPVRYTTDTPTGPDIQTSLEWVEHSDTSSDCRWFVKGAQYRKLYQCIPQFRVFLFTLTVGGPVFFSNSHKR